MANINEIRKFSESIIPSLRNGNLTNDEARELIKVIDIMKAETDAFLSGININIKDQIEHYAKTNNMDKFHDIKSYDEWKSTLTSGDIIIYFRKAGKMAIYKPDELLSVINSDFKHMECLKAETYEFVPENTPQKVIIIGEKGTDDDKFAEKFKMYVMEFLKSKYPAAVVDKAQLIDMRNETRTELLLNHSFVNNKTEKNEFIMALKSFIIHSKNDEAFANRIGTYCGEVCEFPSGELHKIPSHKIINGDYGDLYPLITMIRTQLGLNPNASINITLNQYNNCNNNQVTIGSINNTKKIVLTKPEKPSVSAVKEFITKLKNGTLKPEWYVPNTWVKAEDIYTYYLQIYTHKKQQPAIANFSTICKKNELFVAKKTERWVYWKLP